MLVIKLMSELIAKLKDTHIPQGFAGFVVYTFALIFLASLLPDFAFDPASKQFILVVGFLALWRYSWGIVHYVRHWIFRKKTFPNMRRAIDDNVEELMPSRVYLLVTSFRIEVDTSIDVFKATISEAVNCGIEATIVASIVERADEDLIRNLFEAADAPDHIKLMIVRIPGTGKRDGLAQGFRAISRDFPPDDAVVAVIDGDSILEPGLVRKCAPFFKYDEKIGALTTDELCEVRGSKIMREWHDMRFIQRQVLMCSLAQSRKVLTLTGRMSMFRGSIITDPGFIDDVQNDHLDHWRLGRFKFLTGDDKSSWFWVLKNGWDMMYVPDTVVMTVEHPPSGNFIIASTVLMRRWFGNMLRTNGRALKCPPWKIGLFPWWCILDQRISMWTALTGPVFTALLCIKYSILFLPIYLVWIGFTRWIMTLMLYSVRGIISWYYPFLIYYNQIWGSVIKTYVFFRLDKQKWTRQKTTIDRGLSSFQARWQNFTSDLTYLTAMGCFVVFIGFLSGVFKMPGMF